MRKLLIFFLVAVVVLAVVADIFVKGLAEREVAAELSSALELEDEPEVEIESFPFLIAFAQGNFDAMTISSEDVEAGALRISEITLILEDVSFEPSEVIGGSTDEITIAGGRGSGVLTEQDLTRSLQSKGGEGSLTFSGGEAQVDTDAGLATASVEIDDGVLGISTPDGVVSVTFRLPTLGGRVTYEGIEIEDGEAILDLGVAPGELRRPAES
ncbi:MAG: LmeA family phospholipid-binding protein [Actinomycetota bacterium]